MWTKSIANHVILGYCVRKFKKPFCIESQIPNASIHSIKLVSVIQINIETYTIRTES